MELEPSSSCSKLPAVCPCVSRIKLGNAFPKMHSNIICPSAPRSLNWSLSFRLSNKMLYARLLSPHLLLAPPNPHSLTLSPSKYFTRNTKHQAPQNVIFSTLVSFPSCQSQTSPSHPVTHQIPHAHKTPVPYILIFMVLNAKLADKRFRTDWRRRRRRRQQQQQQPEFPELNLHLI